MKNFYLLGLAGWIGMISLVPAMGCGLSIGEGGGGYSSYYDDYGDPGDETEDRLLVSGSGENRTLEYNTLTFPALLNWKDGNYYFAPDPDGSLSGNKIVCVAAISDYEIEGDCFRSGRVCHFLYYQSWSTSESSDKDSYYVSSTSCKTAGSVGPFLVPLEAPLCGEDPFPACPSDDLFPSGPSEPVAEPSDDMASTVDSLIEELCAAAVRCDATLTESGCVSAMEGEAGKQIWDDFGLVDTENEKTTEQVRQGIADGSITVDEGAMGDCLHEFIEVCDNEGEAVAIGSYENVENLILEGGSCSGLLF